MVSDKDNASPTLVQTSAWTKNSQRLVAKMTIVSNALFSLWVCPLRQPVMSPTSVATSTDKMETFWVLPKGWLQTSLVDKSSYFVTTDGQHVWSPIWYTRHHTQRLDDMEALWGDGRLAGVSLFTLCPGAHLNRTSIWVQQHISVKSSLSK